MFILCAKQRKVNVQQTDTIVSDSVNVYPCKFTFTSEWKGLTRTAVFRSVYNRKVENTLEILLDETNVCNIPWELLVKHGRDLEVGVYGTKGDNLILNTIWQPLGKIYEGAKNIDSDNHPEEPTPDVYQQILSQIGNLEDLETDEKSSLVGAINEVYQKIGDDGPLPEFLVSKEDFENYKTEQEEKLSEIVESIPVVMTAAELRKILMNGEIENG